MRDFIGRLFIAAGFKILTPATRKLVRNIIMYHVPGVLTEDEKRDVRRAKAEWQL